MKMENLLFGIILLLIGVIGLIDSISSRLKNNEDHSGSNMKYLMGSIGLFMIGLLLIIKGIISLF